VKRTDALIACRVAGYHEDRRTFVRIYSENRIRYRVAQAEYERGQSMRESGVPCHCFVCKNKKSAA